MLSTRWEKCGFLAAIVVLILPLVQITSFPNEDVSAKSSDIYDVTKFGATPDDATYDTESIATAIDEAIRNNGGYVYFPTGTYVIGSTLYLDGGTNIVLYGTGTIKMSTKGKDVLHILNSHNISVDGVSVQGWQDGGKREFDVNGNLVFGSGIRVSHNSDDINMKNCKIFNQNINGLVMEQTSNFNVNNCEVFNTRTSIRLDGVTGGTITNNYLHDQKADGVYASADKIVTDVDITNNRIKNFGDTAIDIAGSGSNINVSWNTVYDAVKTSADPNGLGLSMSSTINNFQVISNNITNVSVGMNLDGSAGTITNNRVNYVGISADWTKLRIQDRYIVQLDDSKSFEQFGMSLGGHGLTVSYNTIITPNHIAMPAGWDLGINKIRNYGIKVFGSNNLISDNSLSLYTDKDPIGSSETANVLNYGIKVGGSATGVSVESNMIDLKSGASYNSMVEKGSLNISCIQKDNNLITDGLTISLIKGFL